MSHVFHRNARVQPPTAARGDGAYLVDAAGKRYLDASGGAAVSCLGHSHPRVIQAIKDQLDRLPYAHTGFFTSVPAERLAHMLIEVAPGDLIFSFMDTRILAVGIAQSYCWERLIPDTPVLPDLVMWREARDRT